MEIAFKFSNRGQLIEIATKAVDDLCGPTVKDNRPGMESKDIAPMGAYKRFQRKSREQQGSGLGLSVAVKMCELSGGTLTVQSEIGKKTFVTDRLPRHAGA